MPGALYSYEVRERFDREYQNHKGFGMCKNKEKNSDRLMKEILHEAYSWLNAIG